MAKKPNKAEVKVKLTNFASNRLKRITKHLKKHPNDAQAERDLAMGKQESTRKAPKSKMGWLSSSKFVETYVRNKFVGQITKDAATAHARIFSFIQKAPFHQVPVLVKTSEGIGYAWKHTSKKSNYKGPVEEQPKVA